MNIAGRNICHKRNGRDRNTACSLSGKMVRLTVYDNAAMCGSHVGSYCPVRKNAKLYNSNRKRQYKKQYRCQHEREQ